MLAALAITTVSRGYLVGHLNQVMQFASRASERVIKYDKVIVRKDAKFVPKVWYFLTACNVISSHMTACSVQR